MKGRQVVALGVLVFAFTSATQALAQASDATVASAPQATKKQMHAQNRALVKRVRKALDHTKNLEASDVTVLAKGSTVTLEGTVPEDDQIALAQSVAQSVSGVSTVKNNVRIAIKN